MPQGADELLGRARIAEFVHQGLDRDGVPERIVPIVLLLGPRGSGKTAVLDLLHHRYHGVRPYVRTNLSDDPDVGALRVLVLVKSGLSREVPGVAAISFPRFELGLLALGLDPEDAGQVRRAQLDALIRGHGLAQRINQLQRDWAQRLEPLLGSHERELFVLIASGVLGWALSHLRSGERNRAAAWYDAYAEQADGLGPDPLANLCTWSEADAATALCAALLADLRADFNRRGKWGRTTNCLVALDDVDTDAGMGFLETLARCREQSPREDGPDPLVVVATRGRQPEPGLRVGPVIDAASEKLHYRGWLDGSREQEPRQWCPIALTDLGDVSTAKMVHSHVLGSQARDAQFVHALTRGHPEATRRLAAALAASGDARGLLGRQLRDELIAGLLPREIEDLMLEALTVCVATPGVDHGACDSVFRYLRWQNNAVTVRAVRDFVRETLWGEQDGKNLTPHPLLRLLLSRRLADKPDRWREAHEQFAGHYERVGDIDTARYHSLALVTKGQSARILAIAAQLDKEFKKPTVAQWHATLRRIATAPNRLPAIADPRVTVTELAGEEERGDRGRIIARLLTALWLHNDWLFDPRRQLASVIRDEYTHLGGKADADGGEFYTASEDY